MTVIVTGAAGFLGRHIVERLLARGDRVRALCRSPSPKLEASGVEVVLCDVRNLEDVQNALAGIETVYHVAGVAGMWGPWRHFHQNNVIGTQNVVAACRRQRVQRLIYTSSPSVAFDLHDQCGADESAPYSKRWLCHYAKSKAIAEQAVLAANGSAGLLTCALRPHLIWGPGDRQLLPRMLAHARSRRLWQVGDGTNDIDIIYVENAAAGHIQAADALRSGSPVCGRAYFISQGQPVNCWRWIAQLLAMAAAPPVTRSLSLRTAWRMGWTWEIAYRMLRLRKEPPMTRFLASQLGRSHWFDISAARRDFGYTPEISTAQGMSRLREWLAHQNVESTAA